MPAPEPAPDPVVRAAKRIPLTNTVHDEREVSYREAQDLEPPCMWNGFEMVEIPREDEV